MMAEPLILINAFEVPGEEADQFVAAWEKTRDYLATQPGYVDTALHQAVAPGADFQFVNIGRWQSAEDFLAATQSPGFRESARRPARATGRTPASTASCAPDRPWDIRHGNTSRPRMGYGTHPPSGVLGGSPLGRAGRNHLCAGLADRAVPWPRRLPIRSGRQSRSTPTSRRTGRRR